MLEYWAEIILILLAKSPQRSNKIIWKTRRGIKTTNLAFIPVSFSPEIIKSHVKTVRYNTGIRELQCALLTNIFCQGGGGGVGEGISISCVPRDTSRVFLLHTGWATSFIAKASQNKDHSIHHRSGVQPANHEATALRTNPYILHDQRRSPFDTYQ